MLQHKYLTRVHAEIASLYLIEKKQNYDLIILYGDSLKRNGYCFASVKLMWVHMHTPLHKGMLAQTQVHIQTWIEGSTEQK